MKVIIAGSGGWGKTTFARLIQELYSDAVVYDGGVVPASGGLSPAHWIIVALSLTQVPAPLRRDADIIFFGWRGAAHQFKGVPQKKVGPALLNLQAFLRERSDEGS